MAIEKKMHTVVGLICRRITSESTSSIKNYHPSRKITSLPEKLVQICSHCYVGIYQQHPVPVIYSLANGQTADCLL